MASIREATMRLRRTTNGWLAASSGFVFLALVLSAEGFLLDRSFDGGFAGMQSRSSETMLTLLFHHYP
jgi:hypothetical protein